MDASKYLIIFERGQNDYSAYSPDLPGCVATGKTRDLAEKRMREAIQMHIDGLREDGLPVPQPQSDVGWVSVAVV